ncbi:MAG: uroporphyrinogen-III synthase, partial [Phycisphaerae bacterium]
LTLVTGHESEDKGGGVPTLDVPTLASLIAAGGTVVFYMGVRNLPNIAEQFTQCLQAKAPGTYVPIPAAVIGWATHPHQRTIVGDLSNIAERVEKAGIKPPAIILLGQVVTLREKLNWFENRPLFGQRVLVTRTRQQASELASSLTNLGAQVLEAPTIELADPEDWAPIDASLRHLSAYDWLVFTSANGVRAAWDRLRKLDLDVRAFAAVRTGIAAIGPATADALAQIGLIANLVPDDFVGEALAAALLEQMQKSAPLPPGAAPRRALLLRADIARPALREALQQAGVQVDDQPIYRTVRPASLPDDILQTIREDQVDWVTFTSASTATNLHALLSDELRAKIAGAKRLSIGPQTTAALTKLGWAPTLEASQHDIPGMIAALTHAVAAK